MGRILETVWAGSEHALPAPRWHILFGVISPILGAILLTRSYNYGLHDDTLAIVVGVSLLVIGICEIVPPFRIRKAAALRVEPTQTR